MERLTEKNIKSKSYKRLATISGKIAAAKKDAALSVEYSVSDSSVQAEQRLAGFFAIEMPVDHINYPKDLSGNSDDLWAEMRKLRAKIREIAAITAGIRITEKNKINLRTKTGQDRRDQAEEAFKIRVGNLFLGAFAQAKKQVKARKKEISDLQAEQKELLKKLRKSNSEYLAQRRQEKAAIEANNTAAIASGQFWHASTDAIKAYFKPPFSKNYLADVSEHHRAALFLECESESYKTAYGNWGHKLIGTGRGYLCGIDDNGDEWGHEVGNLFGGYDDFGSLTLDGIDVEDAMAELFNVSPRTVAESTRQGDLLFHPEKISEEITLEDQSGPWEIRESHSVESAGMVRNGRHFKSDNPIVVAHTSHAPITLPAGEYRLYQLQVYNAD